MNQKVYFPNLDGLRFLAFFFVFMYHCYFEIPKQDEQSPLYLVFHKLWENGDLGVNFFFTLSGFLITHLLLVEEKENGEFSIPNFYWRRTLRIWPLYFATLFFGFVIFQTLVRSVGVQIEETANGWHYLLFLGNFDIIKNGDPVSGTLSVLWSLAIEEQFYLFWPLLFLIFKRSRPVLFIVLIIASLIFRSLFYQDHILLFYHTFSVMSDLVVGAILAWWSFSSNLKQEEDNSIPKKFNILIYLLGFVLILLRKDLFTSPILVIFERLIFSLFFAYIIFDQNFSQKSFFKIGNFKRISYWGKFTYGLYCLHIPAMVFTEGFAMIGGVHESTWWVFFGKAITTFLLSLILCRLSYRYLEYPFLKLKDRGFVFLRQ